MLKVIAEQEHYLLISDGQDFTVVERRAGKFYPLCTGVRHGLDLGDETVADEADCLLGPLWFSIRCGLVIARGTAICTEPLLELEQN